MQQYVDKIKNFLVEYKRYFGAGVLFVILVVILIQCTAPQTPVSQDENTQNSDTQSGEPVDIVPTTEGMDGEVQKDANPELVELIQSYYTAYASADIESLEMIVSLITDNEIRYIETFAEYYEEYQNIECYSIPAGSEDAYFVSVCYDLKFKDVDTPAPGMDFFYVERNGKGNLSINNAYTTYNFNFMEQELDANIYAMIIAYEQKEEITALQQSVQARYDEAVASDEKLANLIGGTLRNVMTQWRDSVTDNDADKKDETTEPNTEEEKEPEDTESDDKNTEESEADDNTDSNAEEDTDDEQDDKQEEDTTYTVKTKDICNVRAEASKNGEILGRVDIGVKLTALGTEGDWTKVKFQDGTGYIRTDLLKKVK